MQVKDILNLLTVQQKSGFQSWIVEFRKNFEGFSQRVKPVFEVLGKAVVEISKFAVAYLQAHEKFYLILMEYGWPLPVNPNLHVSEFFQLVEEYENNLNPTIMQQKIDSAMLRWHANKQLQEMLWDWSNSPLLRDRIHILKPAVHAHMKGVYILSIPALLAQIEGIVVSAFRFSGWMNTKKLMEYFGSISDETDVIKGKNRSIKEFVLSVLMVTFIHGEPLRSSLSRHAILHGADTNYGSEINSLKLILLIENLKKLFRFEAIEGRRTYHIYGCPVVRHSRKKRIIFPKAMKAQMAGYEGCRRCNADKYWW